MSGALARSWAVARSAWAEDRKRPKVSRRQEEIEFLPAAVELLEKPASPAGRIFALAIAALFLAALAWGWFGRIDTVAVAPGRIVPGERVKTIQPLEIGIVRAIHVRDGQAVRRGQVLIELDPTERGADLARLEHDLMAARLDGARLTALSARPGDPAAAFAPPSGTDPAMLAAARALMLAEAGEQREAMAALSAGIRRRRAERRSAEAQVASHRDTIPLLRERVEARAILVKKEIASRMRLNELREQLIARERALEVEQRRLVEMAEAIAELERRRAERAATFVAGVTRGLSETMRLAARLEQELAKARERLRSRILRAPVDGTVQQLAVHTVGGVVNPAERLMAVVPSGAILEVEALAANKDIGFVRAGQEAAIKIESFPFTRYGVVDGTVAHVSADSVADERHGLVYPMRVAMARDRILVGSAWTSLAPGMTVTVEVKTGQRRAIEFFLSPLMRYQDEAMRER